MVISEWLSVSTNTLPPRDFPCWWIEVRYGSEGYSPAIPKWLSSPHSLLRWEIVLIESDDGLLHLDIDSGHLEHERPSARKRRKVDKDEVAADVRRAVREHVERLLPVRSSASIAMFIPSSLFISAERLVSNQSKARKQKLCGPILRSLSLCSLLYPSPPSNCYTSK